MGSGFYHQQKIQKYSLMCKSSVKHLLEAHLSSNSRHSWSKYRYISWCAVTYNEFKDALCPNIQSDDQLWSLAIPLQPGSTGSFRSDHKLGKADGCYSLECVQHGALLLQNVLSTAGQSRGCKFNVVDSTSAVFRSASQKAFVPLLMASVLLICATSQASYSVITAKMALCWDSFTQAGSHWYYFMLVVGSQYAFFVRAYFTLKHLTVISPFFTFRDLLHHFTEVQTCWLKPQYLSVNVNNIEQIINIYQQQCCIKWCIYIFVLIHLGHIKNLNRTKSFVPGKRSWDLGIEKIRPTRCQCLRRICSDVVFRLYRNRSKCFHKFTLKIWPLLRRRLLHDIHGMTWKSTLLKVCSANGRTVIDIPSVYLDKNPSRVARACLKAICLACQSAWWAWYCHVICRSVCIGSNGLHISYK